MLVEPPTLARDDELLLAVTYTGGLGTATPEREVDRDAGRAGIDAQRSRPSRRSRILYTNRSYSISQSTVTDYATASMRLTVPENQSCVAAGIGKQQSRAHRHDKVTERAYLYVFTTTQPARYLAVVVTRLTQKATEVVRLSRATATLARNVVAAAARQRQQHEQRHPVEYEFRARRWW